MADVVSILLELRNSRLFQRDADASAKSVAGIGDASETAGEQAKRSWKDVAKWAGGAAAFAATGKFFKDSISATGDLAKSTMALQRSTGLDAKSASQWATVTKARGIETKQFQMGLTKLSKTLTDAKGGSEKAVATLKTLGITQDVIASGDVNGALLQTADAFATMENPAQKAALAQSLFGRSALALRPMLDSGSEGIKEQLAIADRYGATLDDSAVEGSKNLIAQQREMKIAFEGLKIQLGTALLPALQSIIGALGAFTRVAQPILRNATAMKIVVGGIAVAFIAYKAAVVASTLASLGLTTATIASKAALIQASVATKVVTAAQWLWNAAMTANPIGLVIAGIVALGVALVVAYKKSETFRNIVNGAFNAVKRAAQAAFGWIKKNWPLLLATLGGPIGLAAVVVIKNFDKIKRAASNVANWIVDAFNKVKSAVQSVGDTISSVGDTINNLPGGAWNKVKGAIPGMAAGGSVSGRGSYVVGEQGPEIVTLSRGQSVIPTPAIAALAGGGGVPTPRTIVTQVFLDRRQIAEAVGTYASDKLARR
jgi:hypothetical protein